MNILAPARPVKKLFDWNESQKTLIAMGALSSLFAFIILKEVTLSRPVIALAAAAFGFLMLRRGLPFAQIVLYGLVAYLPFSKQIGEDFAHFGSVFNFVNILTVLFLAAWVLRKPQPGETKWEKTDLNVPLYLFTGLGLWSIASGALYGADYLHPALIDYLKRWGIPILFYFLVLNTVKDRRTIRNLVMLMMVVTVLVALMSIYTYLGVADRDLEESRVGGVTDDPNLLGAFFTYYMFLFLALALDRLKPGKHWLYLVPFLLCFRGIMVTFSRAGYLAFVLGTYATVFFRSKRLFAFLLLVGWFFVQNPAFLPNGVRARLIETRVRPPESRVQLETVNNLEKHLDKSAASRLRVWKGSLWMIREHPLGGVGYGLFERKSHNYWVGQSGIDPHNTYLLVAAEMGVPALGVFLVVLGLMSRRAYRLYRTSQDPFSRTLALGFLGGMFGFLTSNFFGTRLDSHEVSSYFWMLAALIVRLDMMERPKAAANISPDGAA